MNKNKFCGKSRGAGRHGNHRIPEKTTKNRSLCVSTLILLAAITACDRSLPGAIITEPLAASDRAAPARLSAEDTRVDIAASEGGGIFGNWTVDRYGLPAYDYTLDQTNDSRGARADLRDRRDAWHQLGNDAIIANAYNEGYTQLWSQQRMYQWTNIYDESRRHYAGGYGYLHLGGETISSLWLDRPAEATTLRRFGVGYYERALETSEVKIEESVTTPYGDLPVLVHEVRLSNRGSETREASWWEYWDVNPHLQLATPVARPILAPTWDESGQTLSVRHVGIGSEVVDAQPLTIFLAAVDAPVSGYETDLREFFGNGTRAVPQAVAADSASNSIAPASVVSGNTLFAMRSPVTLRPGETVTLRYVYGMAQGEQIADIVQQVRAQPNTQAASAAAWVAEMPQVNLGADRRWLSRELQWDHYMVRSSSVYEETCGHKVITQGGYYQYGLGLNIAYRDPLQHMLPVIYQDPALAREVLRYSLLQQPPVVGQISYGMGPLCTRIDGLGTANDLDFWLMLSVVEYVMGTRDFAFLDEVVEYRGGLPLPALSSGTVWDHIKLAYFHQETVNPKGPMGHYVIGTGGDWSDLSPIFLQMTESVLVSTQLAYMYPRLAELAERYGDLAFAMTLRERAAALQTKLDTEWTGGWYSRGYSGVRQIGSGAIFGEPQPWAILAGVPDDVTQIQTLYDNIQRFLTGIGAPPEVNGPAKIGSSQSPFLNDPDVDETSFPTVPGSDNAVFVGGVWYAVNGWLTWAMGTLDGVIEGAAEFALDELERNTLKAHAEAFPEEWNGTLNVDDSCNAHFAVEPHECGIGVFKLLLNINGQIAHQPAWSQFALLKLAGLEPTAAGYDIRPHLPLERWSLRFPRTGLAQDPGQLRGYIKPEQEGAITFTIRPRSFPVTASSQVWVDGERVSSERLEDGSLRFSVEAGAAQTLDWAITQ